VARTRVTQAARVPITHLRTETTPTDGVEPPRRVGWSGCAGPAGWTSARRRHEVGLLNNPIHVLDLGLVLPAAVLTGVLLARRRPWGFVLGAYFLVKFTTLGTSFGESSRSQAKRPVIPGATRPGTRRTGGRTKPVVQL